MWPVIVEAQVVLWMSLLPYLLIPGFPTTALLLVAAALIACDLLAHRQVSQLVDLVHRLPPPAAWQGMEDDEDGERIAQATPVVSEVSSESDGEGT